MNKILITGAFGQIGTELAVYLQNHAGIENVVLTDIRTPDHDTGQSLMETLDVTKKKDMIQLVDKYNIDTIYHMAAVLSGTGEKNPDLCWNVNINGLRNVLQVSMDRGVKRIFVPSSIAVFGPETPKEKTPQETVLCPTTMYGVTKVSGELLAEYYVQKYGLDIRGVRYPGIISSEVMPSGGTTDYAVEIFYDAIQKGSYECFLNPDTYLPMMYLPDAINGTVALMEADSAQLKHHASFNLAAFSFSPTQLAEEITKHIPEFTITYKPDYRQEIAASWPKSIDDAAARKEWHWKPDFNLASMTEDMLRKLRLRLND